ncbi:MAG TPA: hypothetical protein PLI09_24990, partial [Candidatus Hydrogenedentes bacterium]|nr:hypothetical protein [Candidatus Hydrogenedentota bacterium]
MSAMMALALTGGMCLLLYPFSHLGDVYLQRYTQKPLPISLMLILLVVALFCFFCLVMARRRKWTLNGGSRVFHAALLILALLLDAAFLVLMYVLVNSKHAMGEKDLFVSRVMECIPLAGMLVVLALLLFVLPWFRCWGRLRWRFLTFLGV